MPKADEKASMLLLLSYSGNDVPTWKLFNIAGSCRWFWERVLSSVINGTLINFLVLRVASADCCSLKWRNSSGNYGLSLGAAHIFYTIQTSEIGQILYKLKWEGSAILNSLKSKQKMVSAPTFGWWPQNLVNPCGGSSGGTARFGISKIGFQAEPMMKRKWRKSFGTRTHRSCWCRHAVADPDK